MSGYVSHHEHLCCQVPMLSLLLFLLVPNACPILWDPDVWALSLLFIVGVCLIKSKFLGPENKVFWPLLSAILIQVCTRSGPVTVCPKCITCFPHLLSTVFICFLLACLQSSPCSTDESSLTAAPHTHTQQAPPPQFLLHLLRLLTAVCFSFSFDYCCLSLRL